MRKDLKSIWSAFKENEEQLDRIIVSSFLYTNGIENIRNELLTSLLILKNDPYFEIVNSIKSPINFHDVIEAFELAIPDQDKIINGAVYTPDYIKEYIVEDCIRKVKKPVNNIIAADVSCGCGAFLYTLAIKINKLTNMTYKEIFESNLYGLDINHNSIKRAEILLTLLAVSNGEDLESFNFNLHCANALSFDWFKTCKIVKANNGFDVIVGNPPYVRAKNIDNESKKLLVNWEVSKTGNQDLYIPFFEIGLKYLNNMGHLGYITVNSFYKSVNARSLRQYFQSNSFSLEIIDFGHEKIFYNKSVYTCICFLSKETSTELIFSKSTAAELVNKSKNQKNNIKYSALDSHHGWLLNTASIVKNIQKIENTGIPLGKLFSIKNGIATLSNDLYIFRPEKEFDGNYYFFKDGKEYKIEKKICRDIIKPNLLKHEDEIEKLKEKIIFPYKKDTNLLTLISEYELQSDYPNTYEYLSDKKMKLSTRDKGEGNYSAWYAFGRTQALCDHGYKLLFPYMSKTPHFVFTDEKDLMIYCGYAIFSESNETLKVLKKILESSLFDYYMKNTSKPYSGGYLSYAKNYVKGFGICALDKAEEEYLLTEDDKEKINAFILKKYDIELH